MSSITDLHDHYLKTYEDFIVVSDFNGSETSAALDSFLDERKCEIIIKNETCFKSVKGLCLTYFLQVHQVYIRLQTYLRQELATITFRFKQCLSLRWSQKFLQKKYFQNISQ